MAFHRNAPQVSGLKRSSRRVTTTDSCLPPSMYSLRFSLKTQKFLIVLALTTLVWMSLGKPRTSIGSVTMITITFIAPVA